MNDKIKDIQQKMFTNEIVKESKKIPVEELRELWVTCRHSEDHHVHRNWLSFSIMSMIILLIGIVFFLSMTTQYPDSEHYNYKIIGDDICAENELGEYRYIHISHNSILINCRYGEYIIPKP